MSYLVWAVAFFGGGLVLGWTLGARSVGRLSRRIAWPLSTIGAVSMLAAFAYLVVDLA